jgi:hypothetical protein
LSNTHTSVCLHCCIDILNKISRRGRLTTPLFIHHIHSTTVKLPAPFTHMLYHTLSLAHDEFQQVELFLPIKHEWQNALLFLFTLSVLSPSWNYCCVCSRHLRWWLLLLSGGEYMYYT